MFSTTAYFFFSWKEYGQGYHKQEVRWFDYCANDFRWALHISCWAAWSSKHPVRPNCCCRQRPGYRKITHVEFYEMLISLYYCPVCQLYEKWVIPNHRWKSVWHVHKSFQIWKIDIIVKDFNFWDLWIHWFGNGWFHGFCFLPLRYWTTGDVWQSWHRRGHIW